MHKDISNVTVSATFANNPVFSLLSIRNQHPCVPVVIQRLYFSASLETLYLQAGQRLVRSSRTKLLRTRNRRRPLHPPQRFDNKRQRGITNLFQALNEQRHLLVRPIPVIQVSSVIRYSQPALLPYAEKAELGLIKLTQHGRSGQLAPQFFQSALMIAAVSCFPKPASCARLTQLRITAGSSVLIPLERA